jgi:integrase
MRAKLNEKTAKLALPAPGQNTIIYDTELRGFGLRITKNGVKSLVLGYSAGRQERRMTIGRWPAWSVAAAREEAKKLRRLIDQGFDPLAKREEDRTAKTVNDLWLRFETDHLPRLAARAQADVRSMWTTYILPAFKAVKLRDLTCAQVDQLHQNISCKRPVRANRVLEVLRKALNLALRWRWIDRNPAQGFHRNPEQPKDTYLNPDQIRRLLDCLDRLPNAASARAIRLLIYTGARAGEVLRASWTQFDLLAGVWTKPAATTKQRKSHRVPLSAEALSVLQEMSQDRKSPYLFPNSKGQPIADIKRSWAWAQREANLPGVRLHDLRHSFASLLISAGEPLPIIGRLLGHTQSQTTMRYAHLADDPLRRATGRIGGLVCVSPSISTTADVNSGDPAHPDEPDLAPVEPIKP